jgi:ribonuclease BN (tRNA processing enzyme)
MKITVLGSSDAFNGGGRCHSAYVLQSDDSGPRVAVDFGVTSLYALRKVGLAASDLDAVLITHLHGDHFGGLPFLLLDGMYHDVRRRPLDIIGARGLEERVAALFNALYVDVWQRPRPFETRFAELLPGDVRELHGLRVEAFPAAHMDPPDVPLCLRVTELATGKIVAFSGDTEPCEGLFEAAHGADLLIAECSGLRPPCGRHITWDDWRALFAEQLPSTGVKRVVLSHLSREVRAGADTLIAEAPSHFELVFADDGMVIDP